MSNTYVTTYNAPSQAQVDFYNRLCTMKNIAPIDLTTINKTTLTKLIGELQLMRVQKDISSSQVGLILKLAEVTETKVPKLEGWTSQKASEFINMLNEKQKEQKRREPASEAQMNRLIAMFDMNLIKDVPQNITRFEASELIESLQSVYNEYIVTHCSLNQINMIQALQRRLDGQETAVKDLKNFTKESASEMIEQLNYELNTRNELLKSPHIDEDKIQGFGQNDYRSNKLEYLNDDIEELINSCDTDKKKKCILALFELIGEPEREIEIVELVKLCKFYATQEELETLINDIRNL